MTATSLRSRTLAGLAASSLLLLAACGGGSTADSGASLSTRLLSLVTSSATSATFSGNRSDYTITRNANGYAVRHVASGRVDNVASSVTSIVFADYAITLGIGEKSTQIPAADLQMLIELYVAYFNRVPDADGLSYWIGQRQAGASFDAIGNTFYSIASSAEYAGITGYAPTMSNADFVRKIYKNVLGRDTVDAGGLAYWDEKLTKGEKSRGTLVREVIAVAHQFKGDAEYGWVADLLDNKYQVGYAIAVQQGLTSTAADAYAKAVAIAAKVTPTNTAAALAAAGVTDTAFNLPALSLNVSSVTITTPMYRKLATVTVKGASLIGTIKLATTNCANVAETGTASATLRTFTCQPTALGGLVVSVQRASDSVTLASATGDVPTPQVTFKTSMGDMVVELNPVKAPITTDNFLRYVNEGFYTNTLVHRSVIRATGGIDIIQGGGFNTSYQRLSTYAPIKLEWPNGLSNLRGTIAMARTAEFDSATSQWFINTQNNTGLDTTGGGYAVFGTLIAGLDAMDRIQAAPTASGSAGGNYFTDIPNPQVVTYSITQTR